MSRRIRILLLIGTVIAAIGVVVVMGLSLNDEVKAVGNYSNADVRAIRGAICHQFADWRWLTWSNRKTWMFIIRFRLTCHVDSITEDTIGITTIHPDGTRVKSTPAMTVNYTAWKGKSSCRVAKENGRWIIRPRWVDELDRASLKLIY
jgi:hypothetical protein